MRRKTVNTFVRGGRLNFAVVLNFKWQYFSKNIGYIAMGGGGGGGGVGWCDGAG